MKNYKHIVPIALVALFLLSIYMLHDIKSTAQKEYDEALTIARDFREKGILVDAEDYYMKALNKKASVDLYVEIGKFYWESEQIKKATDWGATITKTYPTDVAGYEFLMDVYDKRQDYIACFDLYETYTKRKLKSDVVEEIATRNEYKYYFNGEFHGAQVYGGGLCPIMIDYKWGYVDETGKRVIPAIYSYAGPFAQGIAPVVDTDGNAFFIDTQGNKKHIVLNVDKVEKVGFMEMELFSLYDGSKWHFYNTKHEKVFGDFDEVSAIGNGVAAVKKNGSWSLVDRTGQDLTGKTYSAVAMDDKQIVLRNDRIFVSDGSKYRMIDKTGNAIGDSYSDVCVFLDNTYAAVEINGKWGFIDKNGQVKIEAQYESARSFSNGFAAVMKDGLWGFIDMEGNMVIEPQFEGARDFNASGAVFVCSEEEWRLLRLYKYNH